jgi:hypothetical protein
LRGIHYLINQVAQTQAMAERARVRDLTRVEGNKLLGIVRWGSESVVPEDWQATRWRAAQIILLSAQVMDVPPLDS